MDLDIKHCKYAVPAAPTWVYANDRTLRVSEWAVFENGAVLPVVGDRVVRNGLMPVRADRNAAISFEERCSVWHQIWGAESCTKH